MARAPAPLALVQPEPGQSRYAALAAALRQRIVAGEWPPGTALPSETMLAGEYGVALGTMRRGLELLAEQGLIERHHGKGTFVRGGLSGVAPMLRFFRFGDGAGEVPSSTVLSRQTASASAEVSRRLGVGRGEKVLRIQRLRSMGGEPCLVEDIWLPLPLFTSLIEGNTTQWDDLLYPMFAERCGVTIMRVSDEIRFGNLTASQARVLKLTPGHPCATVTRQSFDLAGNCVELRTTRGDAYAFQYAVTIT